MNILDQKLTIDDAYDAMYDFLDEYNSNLIENSNDDMGSMLSCMRLLEDGISADSALSDDWIDSIRKILKQEISSQQPLNTISTTLTVAAAYEAMLDYVQEYFKCTESKNIKFLIAGMVLIKTEESTDSSMWKNWLNSVEKVLSFNPRQRPWFELLPKE